MARLFSFFLVFRWHYSSANTLLQKYIGTPLQYDSNVALQRDPGQVDAGQDRGLRSICGGRCWGLPRRTLAW